MIGTDVAGSPHLHLHLFEGGGGWPLGIAEQMRTKQESIKRTLKGKRANSRQRDYLGRERDDNFSTGERM